MSKVKKSDLKFNVVIGLGAVAMVLCFNWLLLKNHEPVVNTSFEPDTVEVAVPEPRMLFGYVIDSLAVIRDKVRPNESLSTILGNWGATSEAIYKLASASSGVFNVKKIRAKQPYTIVASADSSVVISMILEPNDTNFVVFNIRDSVWVKNKKKAVLTNTRDASGIITSSLYESMQDLGLSPQLTNDLADVFAWQIDFFRLFKGDKFKVIYDEQTVDGKVVGVGDIKGAYFEHSGNDYYAINYDQGSGIDFFDEEGNSLRKKFLKYPVQFTRISSRYSGRRFHPVQKRYKSHRGTDFAAPKGTPIRSVGQGIVTEAKYGKYNGNYVKIKHNGNYSTQYLHMTRRASGLKPGMKVKMNQVIGYVGSTGLANGNHVCFRFWKNGVQVDAMKVELPPSEPIYKDNIEEFESIKASVLAKLDSIKVNSMSYSGG